MNKVEFVAAVAERLGESKVRAKDIVDAIFGDGGIIFETISAGDEVRLSGFGVYGTKERKARKARNPKTGETVNVAAKTVPYFRYMNSVKKGF